MRKSTTERETVTTTLVAAVEVQEVIIEVEAKDKEAEEIQIVKAVKENLASIGTTDLPRVPEEAEDVVAITRGSRATTTLVVEILQSATQTGFDIR